MPDAFVDLAYLQIVKGYRSTPPVADMPVMAPFRVLNRIQWFAPWAAAERPKPDCSCAPSAP